MKSPVPIAYPERVVYPLTGFTKAQVVDYYLRVAPYLLPHLRRRPVTLKRYPDQAGGEFFYEKDAPAFTPSWVKTFGVWRRSGESQIRYVVIDDRRTLAWAASVGTLEVHSFLARAPRFDSPTEIVFDLDPGEGADILRCAEVAFLLRDLLAQLQLQCFAKLSGSKGLQVYVPLNTGATYAATQPFARAVAEMLAQQRPRLAVAAMERAQRKGRVFIDWSQNADYKTTVSVYSLRAKRRHPYVSMPVTWEELRSASGGKDAASLYFVADAALTRLKQVGDLFAPLLTLQQRLPLGFVARVSDRGAARRPAAPHRHALGQQPPRASAQGGKRRFAIVPNQRGHRVLIELHESVKAWDVDRVPRRAGALVEATLAPAPDSLDAVLRGRTWAAARSS